MIEKYVKKYLRTLQEEERIALALAVTTGMVLAAGFLYLMWVSEYYPLPPCAFYQNIGFYCPMCGSTRAVYALLDGNIIVSFMEQPIILYMIVVDGFYLAGQGILFLIFRFSGFQIEGNRGMMLTRYLCQFHILYVYIGIGIMIYHFLQMNLPLIF